MCEHNLISCQFEEELPIAINEERQIQLSEHAQNDIQQNVRSFASQNK